jgi:hypothetical protein
LIMATPDAKMARAPRRMADTKPVNVSKKHGDLKQRFKDLTTVAMGGEVTSRPGAATSRPGALRRRRRGAPAVEARAHRAGAPGANIPCL